MSQSVLAWTAVVLLTAACTAPSPELQPAAEADVSAVSRLVAEIDRCAREKDLDAFVALSTDDVVSLAPDQPPVVGRDAVRESYRAFYAAFDITMRHRPLETHSIGGLVVHRGIAQGTLTPTGGGASVPFNNKYLFLLQRQTDGSLRVWRAMFNANPPARDSMPGSS